MSRALARGMTLAIGLATPCAAGPLEDVAAATKAWTFKGVPTSSIAAARQ